MPDIFFAEFFRPRIVFRVVVTIRQTDTRLPKEEHVHFRLGRIRRDARTDDGEAEAAVGQPHELCEAFAIGDGRYGLQIRKQRLRVNLLDRGLVHETLIHGAKLRRRRCVLNQGANLLLGQDLLEHREAASAQFGAFSQSQNNADVTFKVMPVLAFGAEIEVARGVGLGPQLRWYVTNVDTACIVLTATPTERTRETAAAAANTSLLRRIAF